MGFRVITIWFTVYFRLLWFYGMIKGSSWDIAGSTLRESNMAIENGPVEIVGFATNSMVILQSHVNVYQRVTNHNGEQW